MIWDIPKEVKTYIDKDEYERITKDGIIQLLYLEVEKDFDTFGDSRSPKKMVLGMDDKWLIEKLRNIIRDYKE